MWKDHTFNGFMTPLSKIRIFSYYNLGTLQLLSYLQSFIILSVKANCTVEKKNYPIIINNRKKINTTEINKLIMNKTHTKQKE